MHECKMCKHREVCRYRPMLLNAISSATFTEQIARFPGEVTISHSCEHYEWDYEWGMEKGGDPQ